MTLSVVGVLVTLVGGCGRELEVLERTGGTGGEAAAGAPSDAEGSGAGTSGVGTGGGGVETGAGGVETGGGGVGAAGGGAGGLEGISVCGSAAPLPELSMGQACINEDICVPNACAAISAPPESNTAAFVACRNHKVQVVTMTLLDMPASEGLTVREGAENWDDCESALSDGSSGDTCTWMSKSCVRHTDDPCCLEGAQCLAFAPLTPPEGVLHRVRLCAPGCTDARPDSTEPAVTDCESASAADSCHATPACEGDFVCHRSLGEDTVSEFTETSGMSGAMWCAGNVLVGGYGTSWGF